jgi:hypothetical protein
MSIVLAFPLDCSGGSTENEEVMASSNSALTPRSLGANHDYADRVPARLLLSCDLVPNVLS